VLSAEDAQLVSVILAEELREILEAVAQLDERERIVVRPDDD
jgi:DNA-directed RNA polymerase specialized sigma subunit